MVTTIFGGLVATDSRKERKLAARWVLAVNIEDAFTNPSYRPWSEVPITFSRADRRVDIPYTGRFPLILDATIQKVLFASALKELGLGIGDLTPFDSF